MYLMSITIHIIIKMVNFMLYIFLPQLHICIIYTHYIYIYMCVCVCVCVCIGVGFPGGSDGKESACTW